RYSFGRAIVASVQGDWSKAGLEREASNAAARSWGMTPEGFFVPGEVWGRGRRDFNVGTTSEAGFLVGTDLRGDLFVDALRAQLVFAPMGAKFLTGLQGNVDIPRKATPGTLGMLTEIGSASETAPVTAKLSLTPKRIGAYVEYSKQALIQSAIGLEGMIRDDLVSGAAVLLEYQAINGNGTAPNILGIRNTAGIGTVVGGTNGATLAWSHFVDLEAACANANASPGALAGYVTNTKVRAKAKQVTKGTNLPFIIDDTKAAGPDGSVVLNTYRCGFTNNVLSNLTKGTSSTVCSAALFSSDWSSLVVGFWGGPDVVVDPYSLAATGQVRITLNQFADCGVRQPAAFAKVDDLLT
ncbi:MAG: phage major capsid protein, partial [Burkholderiales bacterium]|nr:phage major capsid protein [Burkholderiales bacterium]